MKLYSKYQLLLRKHLIVVWLICSVFGFAQIKTVVDSVSNLPVLTLQSDLDHSISILSTNISNARKIHNLPAEAKSHYLLALAYYYRGDEDEAMNHFLQAAAIFSKIKDDKGLADTYAEMGFRLKESDFPRAQKYMLQGMRLAEKGNFTSSLANIYNNYGTLKKVAKQKDSALYYFEESLALKKKRKDSIGIPYSLNNIGEIYLENHEFEKAEAYFNQAMTYRIALKDSYGIADNWAYTGDLELEKNNTDAAIRAYQKSLAIAQKLKITNLRKHAFKMLAEAYKRKGDYQAAYLFNSKREALEDSITQKTTAEKIAVLEYKFKNSAREKQLAEERILARNRRTTIWILVMVISSLVLITFLIYHSLKQKNLNQKKEYDLRTKIRQVEYENGLQKQRLQISRDLHDNIGAHLTCLVMSVDNLKSQLPQENHPNARRWLESIGQITREATAELRETIWAMNQSRISFAQLKVKISTLMARFELVQFHFKVDPEVEEISLDNTRMIFIYRIIQEAINNAVKYSESDKIEVKITKEGQKVQILVADYGRGFNMKSVKNGNGLVNMKNRASDIGWKLSIFSEPEKGTSLRLLSEEDF